MSDKHCATRASDQFQADCANTPKTWLASSSEYGLTSDATKVLAVWSVLSVVSTCAWMKSTNTRSMVSESWTFAGGSETMKSGTSWNVKGSCAVSSPTPGQLCEEDQITNTVSCGGVEQTSVVTYPRVLAGCLSRLSSRARLSISSNHLRKRFPTYPFLYSSSSRSSKLRSRRLLLPW